MALSLRRVLPSWRLKACYYPRYPTSGKPFLYLFKLSSFCIVNALASGLLNSTPIPPISEGTSAGSFGGGKAGYTLCARVNTRASHTHNVEEKGRSIKNPE
ncbi:hypothetical protein BDV37DRAFT_171962 [Aspergillus pseudonomiae]|uniref:Uncharacterized protein n=1 Tax=Aspergillus pseudonomiae TaxID=1506151 RepID=A0A5N7DPK6_9EURO|nr:uncharacterized protein BDV37DRAFT_171962 [Aspergillus pseudonomiae]KAE8408382.1 hypothetical protein BDV37DRAFT_171962 [Aspergillus pseudonomiae]